MPMPTSLRHAETLAFDFPDLFRASDAALLQRFRVTRTLNPGMVPRDFQPNACRIARDLEAITLHFLWRESPEDPGTEIFRFSFQPAT
jgi:hypothetical protein